LAVCPAERIAELSLKPIPKILAFPFVAIANSSENVDTSKFIGECSPDSKLPPTEFTFTSLVQFSNSFLSGIYHSSEVMP
jgi:hypothetical protein